MLFASLVRGIARHLSPSFLGLALVAGTLVAQTTSPSANDGYDPNVNGNVFAMVTQGDGKLIIVGQFDTLSPNGGSGIHRANIARLNPDGTVDSFDPGPDGAVRAIVIQKDGRIVIGGDFTHVGGVARNYLARLNADGTLDTTFSAGVDVTLTPSAMNPPTTPEVAALAIQASDGAIVVGGNFGSAFSNGGAGAVNRMNIARFSSTGALDPNYDPQANGMVLSLASHVDGKMLVGGGFTLLQASTSSPVTRLHMARLNPDGTPDSQFDPKPDNGVTTIKVQADGKILFGGYFVTCQPIGTASPANRVHIGRLNIDGTLDSEFYPICAGNVFDIEIGPDGSIYAGGHFLQVWGRGNRFVALPFAVRFEVDGTIDESFKPLVNLDVDAFAFQPDGKVVIGGYFTRAQPSGLPNQVVRNHIARVLTSGALDTAFQLDPGGRILASVVQQNGQIVIGGSFTNVAGVTRINMARLNADGTLDTTYNPYVDGRVYTMQYDSSQNKVLIGGTFRNIGPTTNPKTDQSSRNFIARLNADGTADSEFNPNLSGPVTAMVLQKDGTILVGGSFSTATPIGATSAITRANILKLTSTGQVDSTFNPMANATVAAIAVQSDGKILVGGAFSAFQPGATGNGVGRPFLARLNADGTVDPNYGPNPNGFVDAIVIQSDGKAVIGGQFTFLLPPKATALIQRNFIARINTDGSVDANFDPNANGIVLALGIQQSTQQILVGGAFTTFTPNGADPSTGWVLRKYFARLNADGTVDSGLNLDLNEQGGNRVDSINVLPDDSFYIGGTFTSLQPTGSTTRVDRNHYAHVLKDGTLDAAFNPGTAGSAYTQNVINAISIQTDGRIILGGYFYDLGGAYSYDIARYTPEGTPDVTFNGALATNGTVNTLAVRATGTVAPTQMNGFAWLTPTGGLKDFHPSGLELVGSVNAALIDGSGRLVIGGSFTDLTNKVQGNLVRFKPDPTNSTPNSWIVDSSFAPTVGGDVTQMILQSDGHLLIVGAFTTVNGSNRAYIARLADDGSLDAFNPNPNGPVDTAILEPDGQHYIIGGSFSAVSPNGSTTSSTLNNIARIDMSGNPDLSFNPNLSGAVNGLAIQTINGAEKIIAVGAFKTAQPNGATTATNIAYAARFNADGTLDTAFQPNPNGAVIAVAVDANNQVLLGGTFGALQPVQNGNFTAIVARSALARVGPDGSVDQTFDPSPDRDVDRIVLEPSGAMLIAGPFNTLLPGGSGSQNPAPNSNQVARNHIARINANGSLDATFNPDFAGNITSITVLTSGNPPVETSILVGGDFTSLQPTGFVTVGGLFNNIGGLEIPNLAELNGDGSVNGAFQPKPNGAVNAIMPLPDGRFVAGGAFTSVSTGSGTLNVNGVVRFQADSTIDPSFTPAAAGAVTALAQQSDGKILVGSSSLIRVNPDGSTDGTFNVAVPFLPVSGLAVQADGKILVSGAGNGTPTRIMRLNADGSVDNSFQPVTFSGGTDLKTFTLQADGKIILAGSFRSVAGTNIGYLARLNSDGTVDSSFNPAPNGTVTAVALQSDGRLVLGGAFTTIGTGSQQVQRVGIARISNTSAASETIASNSDATAITWLRNGTSAELEGATFEWSTDGQVWSLLGYASRVPNTGNWQLPGIFGLPTNSPFYIRARGIAVSNAGQSTSTFETIRQIDLGSPVAGLTNIIGPVVTATAYDQSHYVWTIDPVSGVLRIADARSGVVVNKTVILGGSVSLGTPSSAVRLSDLSTRGNVSPSTPLISGFAITGTSPRTVLVRAIGPGLAPFGVPNYLRTPELILYNSASVEIGSNTGWNNDPALAAAFAQTGAFPLNPGSADSALLITLNPGNYTVQVADAGGSSSNGGDALVEVYDAGGPSDASAHLKNLSSRGTVPANGSLIGGLVIAGSSPKTLLVRGIGPGLTAYGVGGVLVDPQVTVYDSQGHPLATNDNWSVSTDAGMDNGAYAAAVASASASVGAFALAPGATDAALVITLPAGAYTIQLNGVGGTGGAAMIEVYELQ